MSLSFDELRDANVLRQDESFRECTYWSPTDWGNAIAGETGETCNLIKKLRRSFLDKPIDFNSPGALERPEYATQRALMREAMIEDIGRELADVVTYVDLIAQHFGLNLGEIVRSKFNEVSERVGSEVKL